MWACRMPGVQNARRLTNVKKRASCGQRCPLTVTPPTAAQLQRVLRHPQLCQLGRDLLHFLLVQPSAVQGVPAAHAAAAHTEAQSQAGLQNTAHHHPACRMIHKHLTSQAALLRVQSRSGGGCVTLDLIQVGARREACKRPHLCQSGAQTCAWPAAQLAAARAARVAAHAQLHVPCARAQPPSSS
jgi:hypothetical protein